MTSARSATRQAQVVLRAPFRPRPGRTGGAGRPSLEPGAVLVLGFGVRVGVLESRIRFKIQVS